MILILGRQPFRLPCHSQGFRPAQRFSRNQQKRLRPIFAQRDVHQPRIFCAQWAELARICRRTENYSRCRIDGPENACESSFTNRADDDQVVRRRLLSAPQITVEDGNAGSLPFGLPASRQQLCKFGFIAEDDYVGVSQGLLAPRKSFRLRRTASLPVTASLLRQARKAGASC